MKTIERMCRSIAAVLTAAGLLAAGVQCIPAAADEEDSLWTLREYDGDVVSVSCNDKTVTELTVPEVIDGKTITMLEVDGFKDCTALKKITVPETVTVIDDYCFYECSALEEINIPRNLKNIGFQAFYDCSSLTEMQIPASVEEIEAFAFEGCSSLTGVHVASGNASYKDEDGILFDKNGETLYLYPSANPAEEYTVPAGCKTVYDYAFIGNPYLKNVDISGITSLGRDAFYYCTALERIAVPEGITLLDGSVFGKCAALHSVSLPSTLTEIGESCFLGCFALEDIEIPASVESIRKYAFFNCPSLNRVKLTGNVTTLGDYAFGFYLDENSQAKPLPAFEMEADNGTAAFDYCVKNSIKCTGGVTQGVVFVYIVLGVIGVVMLITIILLLVQRKRRKQYELY